MDPGWIELAVASLTYATRAVSNRLQPREQVALDALISDYADSVRVGCMTPDLDPIFADETESLGRLSRSADLAQVVRVHAHARRSGTSVDATLKYMYGQAWALYGSLDPDVAAATIFGYFDQVFETASLNTKLWKALELDSTTVASTLIPLQLDLLIKRLASRGDTSVRPQVSMFVGDLAVRQSRRSERIRPPDFRTRRLVALEEMYVKPSLAGFYEDVDDIVAHLVQKRPGGVVVLGDPGAGKTTLANFVALQVSRSHVQMGGSGHQAVAIVTLREMEARSSPGDGVADFLAASYREKVQLDASRDVWDLAMRQGRLAVIFDGLDEVVDIGRREEYSEIIEGFLQNYPLTPVLVTCRIQGYEEVQLSRSLFRTLHVRRFSDRQIEIYASKWFQEQDAEPDDDLSAAELAAGFVDEVKATGDLCRNPLMLALLAILYQSRRSIPENLSDVYAACTELLFDTWDSHRDLRGLRLNDRVRVVLEDLAMWMYIADDDEETGVAEDDLLDFCTDLFRRVKVEDEVLAREMAEDFLAQATGRSWVFSDVGPLDKNVRRFAFTHRSFMEYFVSQHYRRLLVRDKGYDEFRALVLTDTAHLVGVMTLQSLGTDADYVLGRLLVDYQSAPSGSGKDEATEFLLSVLLHVDLHFQQVVDLVSEILVVSIEIPRMSYGLNMSEMLEYVYSLEVDNRPLLKRIMWCHPANRRAAAAAVTDFIDKEIGSGGPAGLDIFGAACIQRSLVELGEVADPIVESLKQVVERELAGGAADPRSVVFAGCVGLVPVGAITRSLTSAQLMKGILPDTDPPLVMLARVFFHEETWFDDDCEVALRLVIDALQSACEVPRDIATDVCDVLSGGALRPLEDIAIESYSFDDFREIDRVSVLAVLLRVAESISDSEAVAHVSLLLRSILEGRPWTDWDVLDFMANRPDVLSATAGSRTELVDIATRAYRITSVV